MTLETEKKALLTRQEADVLLHHFAGGIASAVQTNYYFDSEDRSMDQRDITCRVRMKDGNASATMKIHHVGNGQSVEVPFPVTDGLNRNGFTDMGLRLCGFLTTCRTVLVRTDTFELVLDRNRYLGCEDYELELEYTALGKESAGLYWQYVLRLLQNHTADGRAVQTDRVPGKSRRFFRRLSEYDRR